MNFATTTVYLFSTDLNHRYISGNDSFLKLLHINDISSFLGKRENFFNFDSDFLGASMAMNLGVIKTGNPIINQKIEFKLNNQKFSVSLTKTPIFSNQKKVIAVTTVMLRQTDLIDNVFLTHLLDHLPYFIFWKDRKSVYLGSNRNFANLVGKKDQHELVGLTDFDLNWGEGEAEYFVNADEKVMTGAIQVNYEEYLHRPDGTIMVMLVSKVPVLDDKQNVIGILGISTEITNLKKVQEELVESRTREAHFKAMSAVGGMMAHELRNSLSSIALNAQTINECFPILVKAYLEYSKIYDIEKIRKSQFKGLSEIANDIEQSARYASNTIMTMLSGLHYSSSETVPIETIDINHVIYKALDDYPLSDVERALIYFHSTAEYKVLGASSVITHVLHNLIKNALYAIKKSGKGTITIAIKEIEKNFINLIFKDTGEGISEEIKSHIFEPFYTTKDSDTSIGLGLFFCKLALEKMEAMITCHSKEGEYTAFVIKLKKCIPA